MGRKSLKEVRRMEIIKAFSEVLADHGYAGATIVHIAEKANLSPGLLHHHFKNKDEILDALLEHLIKDLAERTFNNSSLSEYLEDVLSLGPKANSVIAKCWVGVMAEAIRNPNLFSKVKRHLDTQVVKICNLSDSKLDKKQASSILAYTMGSLVFGAFAPNLTKGFAVKGGQSLLYGLLSEASTYENL